MLDEIDGMLDATQGEDDDTIDIVIVANQKHLKEATNRSEHEMLCTSSVVEIDYSNIDGKGNFHILFIFICSKTNV
jgi:hypothetical protein